MRWSMAEWCDGTRHLAGHKMHKACSRRGDWRSLSVAFFLVYVEQETVIMIAVVVAMSEAPLRHLEDL